jgi:hypothetical protein
MVAMTSPLDAATSSSKVVQIFMNSPNLLLSFSKPVTKPARRHTHHHTSLTDLPAPNH